MKISIESQKDLILVTVIVMVILTIVVVGSTYSMSQDLNRCLDNNQYQKETIITMCENFNKMANLTKKLLVDYVNESFSYESLPNCEALK